MNELKVIYYPYSDCNQLTLAKSILTFDELNFYDYPSINIGDFGSIGKDSRIRGIADDLNKEGFPVNIYNLSGGPIDGEVEKLIDADIANPLFRQEFFRLIAEDDRFLADLIPNGNYGDGKTAEEARRITRNIDPRDIPTTVKDISAIKEEVSGFPIMKNLAFSLVFQSYLLNISSYVAVQRELQLFGDNSAKDSLLRTKFPQNIDDARPSMAPDLSYSVVEFLVPDEAFYGKRIIDFVRFRNEMTKHREAFRQSMLELSQELVAIPNDQRQREINELIIKKVLPESRNYQKSMADNWDKFFKESAKTAISDEKVIVSMVVSGILNYSIAHGLLVGALHVGAKTMPHLIDYLKGKEKIERENPYTYLLKFK